MNGDKYTDEIAALLLAGANPNAMWCGPNDDDYDSDAMVSLIFCGMIRGCQSGEEEDT